MDKAASVLVTGATGFLGLHCIAAARNAGLKVTGTVRDLARSAEVYTALGMRSEELDLFECDLEADRHWNEAMRGMDYVLHVASPFPVTQPDDRLSLSRVAVAGTERVLRASLEAGVKKIVVTGSMNAVAGGSVPSNGYVYSEKDWTNPDDPKLTPYDLSKTLAESAIWDFYKAHPELEVCVIHPGAIYGPVLSPDISASGEVIRAILASEVPAIPRIGFSVVDVRDVAEAHIRALSNKSTDGQRLVCTIDQVWLNEIAQCLNNEFGPRGWPIPMRNMPDILVRLLSPFNSSLKRARDHLGRTREVDNSLICELLGINFRSMEEMVVSMADSLIRQGVVKKKEKSGPF